RRKLCGAGGRRGSLFGADRGACHSCGRAVPVDAAALLEPRDRPARGVRRGGRADAAGGVRRSCGGVGHPRPHRGARPARAPAVLVRPGLDLPGGRGRGRRLVHLAQHRAGAPAVPGDRDAQLRGLARAVDAVAGRRHRRPAAPRVSAAVRSLARTSLALLFSVLLAGPAWSAAVLDEAEALRIGQAAIGRQLDDYVLRDTSARRVALADFRGKPLMISFVYTSCSTVCPIIVQTLDAAVGAAEKALGQDSFAVVTVGFDVRNDTPERMR